MTKNKEAKNTQIINRTCINIIQYDKAQTNLYSEINFLANI